MRKQAFLQGLTVLTQRAGTCGALRYQRLVIPERPCEENEAL
jgi:hypothetical protein